MGDSSSNAADTTDKRHILVVDDDQVWAESLARILRSVEFEVSIAGDFRLALELLESDRRLDLLIADIVMPGSVNGIALSRMARLRRRDLKIIYMTGYSIPGVDREALGPILRKPIHEAELLAEVERVLTA